LAGFALATVAPNIASLLLACGPGQHVAETLHFAKTP